MHLKDNHLFYSSGAEFDNFIAPLKKYHINYFTYRKFYTDQSRIFLGSRVDWFNHYLSNQYYLEGNIETNPKNYQAQAVLWSTLPNQYILSKFYCLLPRSLVSDRGISYGGTRACRPSYPLCVKFIMSLFKN